MGSKLPFPSVTTVKGRVIPFTRTTGPRFVHLCIARFSGCPMCNLAYRNYARKLVEVQAADCEFVIVCHSTAELILENQGSAEWAFASEAMSWVASPSFEHHTAVGSGRQAFWRFFISPTVLVTAVKSLWAGMAPGRDFFRRAEIFTGVKNVVPVDIMVDTRSGVITAISYGPSVADHKDAAWAVAEAKKAAAAAP